MTSLSLLAGRIVHSLQQNDKNMSPGNHLLSAFLLHIKTYYQSQQQKKYSYYKTKLKICRDGVQTYDLKTVRCTATAEYSTILPLPYADHVTF